ncbi:uncharacterized protein LOC117124479 [Anneissia japonica]|uniref:uncharacterized protein LOC117124479 n=1 Tax=Anneissia japonica TaxID=1529436 RepID=UPI001425992A|nr:uncharacterized protein LOC117124479 [Anneissia japonica]
MNNILGNCSYFPISSLSGDAIPIGDGFVRMGSMYEILKLDGDMIYKGASICREMTCERWITIRYDWPTIDPFPTVWEWYFAMSNWIEVTDLSWETQVPVQLIVRDAKDISKIIFEEQLFDFNYREPSVTEFTSWSCMKTDNYEFLQFEISSHYNEMINSDKLVFYQRVQAAISKYADVTPLRTPNVQLRIDENDRNFVRFFLYDVAPIQGGVGKIEPSIAEARDKLQKNIDTGEMVIRMPLINMTTGIAGQITKDEYIIYANADSLQSVPEDTVEDSKMYSKGAVIGMGIGMGVLSFLLGGIICFLIAFKNRDSVNEGGFTMTDVTM